MSLSVRRRKRSKCLGLRPKVLLVFSFGFVAFYEHALYSKKSNAFSKGLVDDINEMTRKIIAIDESVFDNHMDSHTYKEEGVKVNENKVNSDSKSNEDKNVKEKDIGSKDKDGPPFNEQETKHIEKASIKEASQDHVPKNIKSCLEEAAENKFSSSLDPKRKFSYAFLIAGCDPGNPSYLGYIYNILVARELLKMSGSSQDVIVLVRMYEKTDAIKLPDEHEDMLTKSGIIIKYIPKPITDNFHTAMMDKFRILELDEYDRVLYLDADVMPLNNLDYMFYLSTKDEPDLAENVAISYNNEPVNGGFFMLTPNKEDFNEVQRIIEKREMEGYDFNKTIGFGHQITPPDHWESLTSYVRELHNKDNHDNNQVTWDFYGSFTDQGLLYHYTKYMKQKLTIVNGNKVQTWGSDESGKLKMISERLEPEVFGGIERHCTISPRHHSHVSGLSPFKISQVTPYMDFHHFKGKLKPWLKNSNRFQNVVLLKLWFQVLKSLNEKYGYKIYLDKVKFGKPNLGLFPTNEMVLKAKMGRVAHSKKKMS